jgi:aminoglycoside 6-adenylyltransferase
MDQPTQAYAQLIGRFVKWAKTEPGVRTAIIIGSRARTDNHPADEWSDLDIVMFVTNPEHYLTRPGWIEEIGNPWLTFIEPAGAGQGMERRVLFEGGLDTDFAFIPVNLIHQMEEMGLPSDVADILRRGVEVLFDKDGLWERLQVPRQESQSPQPPSQAEFLELVNDFWYHAVWTAKKLRRGELWVAKGCSDNYMKSQLLRMVEWHARARNGWDYDIWHKGRFLEQWASHQFVKALPDVFAYYDREDLWRGLLATMDLFRWLTVETAERLDFSYPTGADEHVAKLVHKLFSERD